ncbi:7 transmembrane receptor [Opisthorchis viverrini]|uniref:Uncharacterized protein n=2 Tax=Opisthorchis viverrini TaxID=6198 RepID=A0A074Z9B7_OPIVI|nr:hypothetical protein T265_14587 [Opisthorchis viverrini]KER23683.1 hypothetical protein T265_14587 [Opisthorchis viverrini]OON14376.1 7 transmembrane receptor [Opisthorchis viverrini]
MSATETISFYNVHPHHQQQHTCNYTLRTLGDIPSFFQQSTTSELSSKHLVVLGFVSVLVTMTILGNTLICVAAATNRQLRHRSNVFFVSLAITNLLYAAIVMTFSVAYNIFQPSLFTDAVCISFHTLDSLFCASSILHLVAIAFDRLIHISSPLTYSRTCTTKIHFVVISVLWVVGVLLAFLPQPLGCRIHRHSETACFQRTTDSLGGHNQCGQELTHAEVFARTCYHKSKLFCALFHAVFVFIIPLLIMLLIYSRLFLLTRKHLVQIKNQKLTSETGGKQDEKTVETNNQSCNPSLNGCASTSSLRSAFFVDTGEELTMAPKYLTDLAGFQELPPLEKPIGTNVPRPKPRHCKSALDTRELTSFVNNTSRTNLFSRQRNSLIVPTHSLLRRYSDNSRCSMLMCLKPKFSVLSSSAKPYNNLHSEYKAAVTLGLILGSFLLCWLPMFLLDSISALCDCIPKNLFFAATWLGYSNACVNPIIYSVLNSKFRRACIKLLCNCCRPKEKDEQYGLAKLRFTGNTTIQLALGTIPWKNRDFNACVGKEENTTNR